MPRSCALGMCKWLHVLIISLKILLEGGHELLLPFPGGQPLLLYHPRDLSRLISRCSAGAKWDGGGEN